MLKGDGCSVSFAVLVSFEFRHATRFHLAYSHSTRASLSSIADADAVEYWCEQCDGECDGAPECGCVCGIVDHGDRHGLSVLLSAESLNFCGFVVVFGDMGILSSQA
jgi:hypothetical protein